MKPMPFAVHIDTRFIRMEESRVAKLFFGNALKLFQTLKGLLVEIEKTARANGNARLIAKVFFHPATGDKLIHTHINGGCFHRSSILNRTTCTLRPFSCETFSIFISHDFQLIFDDLARYKKLDHLALNNSYLFVSVALWESFSIHGHIDD